jgi:histidinol-phosphatase
MNPEWRNRYEVAVTACRRAGLLALGYYDAKPTVEWKADQTPVTIADREGEQLLRSKLLETFPDDGFLGEESGERPGTSGFRWIIDPIDGTKNFVRGIPIWGTLVGLEYKGETIAGVVEAPALNQSFRALRGDGAYRGDRRIHVSDCSTLDLAVMICTTMTLPDAIRKVMLKLGDRTQVIRGYGDFYGYMLVASGCAEVMAEYGVHPWDVAATRAIVEEAGGRFTAWDGSRSLNRPDTLATNGRLHDAALAVLKTFNDRGTSAG